MYKKLLIISVAVFVVSVFASKFFLSMKQKGSYDDCVELIESGKYQEASEILASLVSKSPGNAEYRLELGKALEELNDISGAEQQFKKTLDIDPKNEQALVRLGRILTDKGEYEAAKGMFDIALEVDPKNSGAIVGNAVISFDKKEYEKALKLFEEALKIDSSSVDALAGKAKALKGMGKIEVALLAFKKAVKDVPDNADLKVEYGTLLAGIGKYGDAEKEFNAALKIDDRSVAAMRGLGDIYSSQGLYEKAQDVLQNALKVRPEDIGLIIKSASLYRNAKQYDKAMDEIEKGLKLKPDNVDILVETGKISRDKEDFSKALEYFNKVNEIDSKNVEGLIGKGSVYFRQGKLEDGNAEFGKAIQIDSKDPQIYSQWGRAYINGGMYYEGIQELQKVLEMDPDARMTHYYIGLGFLNGGFSDVAVEEFKAEIEMNPGHAPSHFNLGLAYSALGNTEESLSEYKKALELNPLLTDARYNLALVYAKGGKSDMAVKEFEKILKVKENDSPTLYNLGILYAKTEAVDKAIDMFQRIVKTEPSNIDARDNLAVLYENKGKFDEAISQYQEILSTPDLASPEIIYTSLGAVYLKKGDFSKAKEFCEKAVSSNPNYAPAFLTLGKIYEYNSKGERFGEGFDGGNSITNYQKAVSLDPQLNEAVAGLKEVKAKAVSLGIDTSVQTAAVEAQPTSGVPVEEEMPAEDNKTQAMEAVVLGDILYDKGELEDARAEWERALSLDPDNANARSKIEEADALIKSNQDALEREKQEREVAQQKEREDAEKKEQISALLESGQMFYDQGDYNGAITEWEKVLVVDPNNDVARSNIEKTNETMMIARKQMEEEAARKAEEEKAAQEKNQALQSQEINNYLSTASIYLEEGYFDEAINALEKVLELDPENEQAKQELEKAMARLEAGGKEAAVAEVGVEGEEYPEDFGEGSVEKDKEVISPLKARLNNQRIKDYLSTGDVLMQVGDFDDALKAYQDVLKIDPNNEEALKRISDVEQGRGLAQEQEKKKEEMRKFEEQKLAKQRELNKYVSEYLTEGEVKFNRGNYTGAIAVWNSILELDPANAVARKKIAEAKELKIAKDVRIQREQDAKNFAKKRALLRIKEAQSKKKKTSMTAKKRGRRGSGRKKLHVARKKDAFLDEKYLEETLGSITGDYDDTMPMD